MKSGSRMLANSTRALPSIVILRPPSGIITLDAVDLKLGEYRPLSNNIQEISILTARAIPDTVASSEPVAVVIPRL
jgi:hypothetical protein